MSAMSTAKRTALIEVELPEAPEKGQASDTTRPGGYYLHNDGTPHDAYNFPLAGQPQEVTKDELLAQLAPNHPLVEQDRLRKMAAMEQAQSAGTDDMGRVPDHTSKPGEKLVEVGVATQPKEVSEAEAKDKAKKKVPSTIKK